jgi:AbrB family looped-hinge helix DNA binding protein
MVNFRGREAFRMLKRKNIIEARRDKEMNTYRVLVGAKGEIILPLELRESLGLVEGDSLDLEVSLNGKIRTRSAERTVGPLADFFEDLILNDLHCDGCSGDLLKEQFYLRKTRLSTVLDRLAEEAREAKEKGQGMDWRMMPELEGSLDSMHKGNFKVFISTRAERDLLKLSEVQLTEVSEVFEMLELHPVQFKRLRGPFYDTYRVSFNGGKMTGQYRVIYTVFEDTHMVSVLSIGERKDIYNWLKGLA